MFSNFAKAGLATLIAECVLLFVRQAGIGPANAL
jgi:hypothetical protein